MSRLEQIQERFDKALENRTKGEKEKAQPEINLMLNAPDDIKWLLEEIKLHEESDRWSTEIGRRVTIQIQALEAEIRRLRKMAGYSK